MSNKGKSHVAGGAAGLLAVFLVSMVFTVTPPVVADSGDGWVSGEGTCFQVTNSTYLNVTLCSTEVVNVTLESIPSVVSFAIRAVGNATSTDIEMSGFVPNAPYYRHQDGYMLETFVADEAGNYSYTQDLSVPHHVFIDKESGTKYIRDDATGGDCTIIGTWDSPTKTCTLTTNVLETIVMDANGITLDGDGHSITYGTGSYGVYASYRSGFTIKDLSVSGFSSGIFLVHSNGGTVSRNTVTADSYGISLSSYSSSTVSDNAVTVTGNSPIAIYLYQATSITMTGNTMNKGGIWIAGFAGQRNTHTIDATNTVGGKPVQYCKNRSGGTIPAGAGQVVLASCSNMIVENQDIANVYVGIAVHDGSGNTIRKNTVAATQGGIYLRGSNDTASTGNVVSGNTVTGAFYGIYLYFSRSSTVSGNTVTGSIYGIYMAYLFGGGTVSGNTVTGVTGTEYGICLDGSSTVSGNTVTGAHYGIYLGGSSTVSGNTVTGAFYGIYLGGSSTVSGNTVTGAHYGIYLGGSSTVSGNTVTGAFYGIYLYSSQSNIVSGNTVSVSGSYPTGIYLYGSQSSIVSGNTVSVSGSDSKGVYLASSTGSTVTGNTFSGAYFGIHLSGSGSSTISGNTVLGVGPDAGTFGVRLDSSGSNLITCNAVRSNRFGFYLSSSSGSTIYHNNLIYNPSGVYSYGSTNTWNNPANEGNFWSYYYGLDNGAGGRIAGDGIGDTNLPHRGVDSYPLMRGAACAYNFPPEIQSFTAPSKPEGTPVVYTAQASDPEKYDLTYSFDIEGDGTYDVSGPSNTVSHAFPDDFTGTAKLLVSDGVKTAEKSTSVAVTNAVPTVSFVRFPPGTLNPSGTPITFTANFADAGVLDTHTATWTIDGTTYPGTVSESGGSGTVADTFTFAAPVQRMTLRVTDDDGGWSEASNWGPVITSFTVTTGYYCYCEGGSYRYYALAYDPDGIIDSYGFDFQGDGTIDSVRPYNYADYTFLDDFDGTARAFAGDRLLTSEASAPVHVANVQPYPYITSIAPHGSPPSTDIFAPSTGVLAHFEFNGDVLDSSGNGRDATLLGGDFIPSEFGQGLHVYLGYDPNTYDVLPMGIDWSSYAQELGHPFTVEFVFTSWGYEYEYQKLFGPDDALDDGWYSIYCGFETMPPGVGKGWAMCPGQRHYLALVSTSVNEMDVYVDGMFIGSSPTGLPANLNEAIFFRDDSNTNRYEQLDAVVDALRISSVRRTPEEITALQQRLQGIAPPVPVGTAVSFTGAFWDAGILDTHTASWSFDDLTIPGLVVENGGSGIVTGTHSFTAAGVYKVTLTVEDDDGGVGTSTWLNGLTAMVVVYDPNGGFVTGSGWIDSPLGAYLYDPAATGKATFGFVSKYQKGQSIPSGNAQFRFQAADLLFQSTSYQWLVVAGPKAMFKGYGTLTMGHGQSQRTMDVGFLVTAVDGQLPGGGGVDKFRIKIWNRYMDWEVVYDNLRDWPDDAEPPGIGGGQIAIQKT